VLALESIVEHGSSILSEDKKVGLVRDYVKMSGLDRRAKKGETASKRQRTQDEKGDEAPPAADYDEPKTGMRCIDAIRAFAAQRLAASQRPLSEERDATVSEDERSNYSDDDSEEEDSDSFEPRPAKRARGKEWTDEDDAVLVAALRAGQQVTNIKIPGRGKTAAKDRLRCAKLRGLGGPALRKYLEETCPEYVYRDPSERRVCKPWSADEDQTFIQAHREGKTHREIAAMLPGRSADAVKERWYEAKLGKSGTAALRAYAAEYRKNK